MDNGVNCYTCHRGQNVPEYIWFEEGNSGFGNKHFVGWRDGQNRPVAATAYSTLPSDAFTQFLLSDDQGAVRLASDGPFSERDSGLVTTKEAEYHYSLMMHYSASLGVNCTYCHQTASFQSWEQSTPARITAWQGQSMVRALNADYLVPLGPVILITALDRTWVTHPKRYCMTCHQGVNKPLGGADAVSEYPALASK